MKTATFPAFAAFSAVLLLAPPAAFHAAEAQAAGDLPVFRYHGVVLQAANLKIAPTTT